MNVIRLVVGLGIIVAFIAGCAGQEIRKNEPAYAQAQKAYQAKNYEVAYVFAKQAAKHDDADAQYLLGFMYFNGMGTEKNLPEAVRWFDRSAAAGNKKAEKAIEEAYSVVEEAFNQKQYDVVNILMTRAAASGDGKAQYLLGFLYYYGLGVAVDQKIAKSWFNLSAKNGYAKAQEALRLYETQ